MSTEYLRIEKALNYLEEHFQDQPSLQELADHLNMSPFHFQRVFKRWAGISPKRFIQFLTIDYAKKMLDENRSVLDATYESGLSSPGRLHDLFVTIDGVTPGEFKTKGIGIEIVYGIHSSPFGDCLLAITERGICGLTFTTDKGLGKALAGLQSQWEQARLRESTQTTKTFLDQIFTSSPGDGRGSVSLFLKGTNFQIKVWEALLKIPQGFVCSYEEIAGYLGKPTAARAVGNAVAANPVAYIIPCHRVIRKIGAIGNYRHGTTRKKAMIGWEAAQRYRREASL
jgi:AraC family transcriptional regulator of adaptative response/methylated-DNA-[protein]-cysteine methyltransferase